jgi:secreted trypsin-like serine protease
VVTAGWGLTEDRDQGGVLSTDHLRAVGLDLYSDSSCRSRFAAAGYPSAGLDFTTEVCALAPGKDACNGDSGGPLMSIGSSGALTLVGVVSQGTGCGYPTQYGVYARVGEGPLRSWLDAVLPKPAPAAAPAASAAPAAAPKAKPKPKHRGKPKKRRKHKRHTRRHKPR